MSINHLGRLLKDKAKQGELVSQLWTQTTRSCSTTSESSF